MHSGHERFETRLAALTVISRVMGVHKLLLLNFYPFVQKYCQPHQREVTQLLAALVQVRQGPGGMVPLHGAAAYYFMALVPAASRCLQPRVSLWH